jgi:hypothetical protein
MSSKLARKLPAEPWLVLAGFAGFMLWYGSGQLLRTLYFTYQVVQFLFPHWLPPVGGPGG